MLRPTAVSCVLGNYENSLAASESPRCLESPSTQVYRNVALGDMAAQLPAASPQLIKKVLAEMKKAGQARLAGRGRGARWEVVR